MDVERDDEVEPHGGWEWVKTQEEKRKKGREEVCSISVLRTDSNCEAIRALLIT